MSNEFGVIHHQVHTASGSVSNIAPAAAELPARLTLRRAADRLAYIVGIVAPLSTVPQAHQIFTTRSAEDISIATWVGFEISAAVWLAYGIVHGYKPVIITNSIWLLLQAVVIAGAIIYANNP